MKTSLVSQALRTQHRRHSAESTRNPSRRTPQQYIVASASARSASDSNFDRICQYLNRKPTEFRVLSVGDALLYVLAIRSTAAYITTNPNRKHKVAARAILWVKSQL